MFMEAIVKINVTNSGTLFQCKHKLYIKFEHQLIKEASSLSTGMLKRALILLSSYFITIYLVSIHLHIFYFKI